jgi:small subunit ribosomal protein S1
MVVAIDGPAGAGKSTVARLVASRHGLTYVNSGNLYRAITFEADRRGVGDNPQDVVDMARSLRLVVEGDRVILDGEDLTPGLRTDAVEARIATISRIPDLREVVNGILRDISKVQDIIVEGRDMTTVVFPQAEVKVYLDASIDSRAQRRFDQGTSGQSREELARSISARDNSDMSRQVGQLKIAPDALYLDSTGLTIEQVCATVAQSIQGHTLRRRLVKDMAEKVQQINRDARKGLQEELQEEYLKSLDELEAGQLVDGTIVAVRDEFVFIDVGYKSEGKIPMDEFLSKPAVGDKVQVVLVTMEGKHGEVVVSKRKADEKVAWRDLKQAFTDQTPVQGKVVKVVKGGFEVVLANTSKAFNPISKMDLFRIEEPEGYVGLESKFQIERLFHENRINIIVSRRAWLEKEVTKNKEEFFSTKNEGDVVEGTVKSFTSFGAFVDLGGFDGLLHINDMSWGHVTRPKDHVKKGEVLKLIISKLDHENQKINLSLKELKSNPWDGFNDRYQVDDNVKGTVTKLTDFGAFIEIEEGIEGLVHISELSWTKRIKHPREVLKIGDAVEAKILGFDLEAHKVSLGMKQVTSNPWDTIDTLYPVGTRLTRVVKKITNTGAFIELEEGIDAFLHIDDLSWTKKPKAMNQALQEGQELEVVVIAADPEHKNIKVGVKQLADDPWQTLKKNYPEGTIISGEITNITDFGIFVRVVSGIEGLIPKSQLADGRFADLDEEIKKFKVGETVKAAVLEIQAGKGKLSLSLREMQRQMEQGDIAKYLHDEEGEKSTMSLGDLLKKDE